ncbi:unnamed protein product [Cyprideis torosa]|uniref:Uncharacterized protein n=1 Tax=Cyprideis torosa TaxID=163714 RepID=A0A7R8ZLZ3_9CRUS|nr:unnamed protein product [Cyprideis torosa]CAG0884733.1 unnamed protein product [Cyprideis torosa]
MRLDSRLEDDGSTCHLLGDYLEAIDQDYEKARKVYEDNCVNYDYTGSCRKAGYYKIRGKGGPTAIDSGMTLLKKACLENDSRSCFTLGELKTKDNEYGVAQNAEEGMRYLEKSCNLGEGQACFHLAGLFFGSQKLKVQKNMEKAFEYSLKACEKYMIPACGNVSLMYLRGDGVQKDPQKAAEYRRMVLDYEEQRTRATATLQMEQGLPPVAEPQTQKL